jgi:hypothetical protein
VTLDERVADWVTWYQANRPRHEGSADVPRQLAFLHRALDGQFQLLLALHAELRRGRGADSVIQVPRLVGRL